MAKKDTETTEKPVKETFPEIAMIKFERSVRVGPEPQNSLYANTFTKFKAKAYLKGSFVEIVVQGYPTTLVPLSNVDYFNLA